jgi:hypothetical protein
MQEKINGKVLCFLGFTVGAIGSLISMFGENKSREAEIDAAVDKRFNKYIKENQG